MPETANAAEDEDEVEPAPNPRTRSAQPNKASAQPARKRRSVKKRRRWPKVVLAALVALCVIAVGAFSWHRWLHGDDMADMLGVWYVPSGTAPITVEGNQIVLAEDVSYSYQLDTGAKTIEFSFGQMTGRGYYHFSLDRQTLVVQDGEYTWFDTLAEDASWVVRELAALVRGEDVPVPQGDNVLVLVREA